MATLKSRRSSRAARAHAKSSLVVVTRGQYDKLMRPEADEAPKALRDMVLMSRKAAHDG